MLQCLLWKLNDAACPLAHLNSQAFKATFPSLPLCSHWPAHVLLLEHSCMSTVSSIYYQPLIRGLVAGGAGCFRARGTVHPGRIASQPQSQHIQTTTHTYGQFRVMVEGSWSARRTPTSTRESNPGPSSNFWILFPITTGLGCKSAWTD